MQVLSHAARPRSPTADGEARQELRIALVMNGGVSLAVWIGGVVREMARLVAAPAPSSLPSIYRGLCELLAYDPQVDVIAGTSAGAVNGAYLALALSRLDGAELEHASAGLRQLWMDDGTIQDLIRSPLEAKPPSLLDGDGVYYNNLLKTFNKLAARAPRDDRIMLDLLMTTTMITGDAQYLADDFGSSIPNVTHRGRFHFHSRRPEEDATKVRDHFGEDEIADRLAVAARSSSSFPGAFEPSFCPVGAPAQGRPDMAGIASFAKDRFVIDGGILDNMPLDVALDCIFARHASTPARRVLAYIAPDPGSAAPVQPDKPDNAPGLLSVVFDSLVAIPTVQSIAAQVAQLQEHNKAVREKRRQRSVLAGSVSPGDLDMMSTTLFEAYRRARAERALEDIIDGLNKGLSENSETPALGRHGRKRAMRCAVLALLDSIPWVPDAPPLASIGKVSSDLEEEQLRQEVETARKERGASEWGAAKWGWGTRPVHHLSRLALDLLVRAEKAGLLHGDSEQAVLWDKASRLLTEADELRASERGFWKGKYAEIFEDGGRGALRPGRFARLLAIWGKAQREDAANLAVRIAILVRMLPTPPTAAQPSARPDRRARRCDAAKCEDALEDYRRLHAYFVRAPGDSPDLVLARLLAFTVIDDATSAEGVANEEIVEFIQISGDDDEITGNNRKAADKLNGIQLAHFAAFYKLSWRANDWCWGRRDAVGRILRVMLDPARLRDRAQTIAARQNSADPVAVLLDELRKLPGVEPALDANRAKIVEELAYLADPSQAAPDMLRELPCALAAALDAEIFEQELPRLAEAIWADDQQHNATGSTARDVLFSYVHQVEGFSSNLMEALAARPSDTVAERFAVGNGLGDEKWKAEVGTDPSAFVATRILAVATAALRADDGIALLGPLLAAMRVPTLMLYAMARNACMGSRIGLAINTTLLVGSCCVLAAHAAGAGGTNGLPHALLVSAAAILLGALVMMLLRLRSFARWLAVAVVVFATAAGVVHYAQQQLPALEKLGTERWIYVALAESVLLLCFGMDRLLGLRWALLRFRHWLPKAWQRFLKK